MKLAGWQLVVVLLALLATIVALAWHGVLDPKSIGLAITAIVAWLVPSPFAPKVVAPVDIMREDKK